MSSHSNKSRLISKATQQQSAWLLPFWTTHVPSSEYMKSDKQFGNFQYLPWYHRPLPLYFAVLKLFTPYVLMMTAITTSLAMVVVQIQINIGADPVGGDGFAFLFTVIVFLCGLYIPIKMATVNDIGGLIGTLQQHLCHVLQHSHTDFSSFVDTRNRVIGIIRDMSSAHSTLLPETHILNKFKSEFAKELRGKPGELDGDIVLKTCNSLMFKRPTFAFALMESMISFYILLASIVFYPILLKESIDGTWAWIPMQALIAVCLHMLNGLLAVTLYEMNAWGVTPVPRA